MEEPGSSVMGQSQNPTPTLDCSPHSCYFEFVCVCVCACARMHFPTEPKPDKIESFEGVKKGDPSIIIQIQI